MGVSDNSLFASKHKFLKHGQSGIEIADWLPNIGRCAEQRDLVAKKLKGSQLSEAQRMSSEFAPKKEPEK